MAAKPPRRGNYSVTFESAAADQNRHLQELGIFHDVAKALTSSLNLDSVLQTIMEKMAEYFRPDTWSLLMTDEEKQELYFAIAVGDAAEALKTVRLKLGEGIAGWVAQHGESVLVPDVYTDPRFAKRIDEMTKWQTRSIICIPLKSKHRVLGVIQLINWITPSTRWRARNGTQMIDRVCHLVISSTRLAKRGSL